MPPRRNPTRGGGGQPVGPVPIVFPAPDAEIPLVDIDPHQQEPHLQVFHVSVFVPDLVAAPQENRLRLALGFPGRALFRQDPPGLRVEEIVFDADARFLRFRIRALAGLGQLAAAARGAVTGDDFALDPTVPLCVQVANATGTGRLISIFSFFVFSFRSREPLSVSSLPTPSPSHSLFLPLIPHQKQPPCSLERARRRCPHGAPAAVGGFLACRHLVVFQSHDRLRLLRSSASWIPS